MSLSALSIGEHFAWMLCYLETLDRVTLLVASSREIPQFGHFADYRDYAVTVASNVRAHALAARDGVAGRRPPAGGAMALARRLSRASAAPADWWIRPTLARSVGPARVETPREMRPLL